MNNITTLNFPLLIETEAFIIKIFVKMGQVMGFFFFLKDLLFIDVEI